MAQRFAEKATFLSKRSRENVEKIDFPKISTKICNISIWCMRISQNLDLLFLLLPVPIFSRSTPFLFPALLRPLPLIVIQAALKNWTLTMGKAQKWDLVMINYRYSRSSYHSKTNNVVFYFFYLRIQLICKTDHCVDRSILALPPAYQDYLASFKLMTPQVVPKARPLKANINILGTERVQRDL